MKLPYVQIDEVYHIGSLEAGDRGLQAKGSLEAFCLSVSLHPEDWSSIARLGGNQLWSMSRPGSLWLDVLGMDPDGLAEIARWAEQAGYVEPSTHWRAWFTDEEGNWSYMRCDSLEAAEREIDDPDEAGPCPDGSRIDFEEGYRLTKRGMRELERWQEASDALDGMVILYARDVVAPAEPRLAGLWWDETYDPNALSCPRGGILPARLPEFEARPIASAEIRFSDHPSP